MAEVTMPRLSDTMSEGSVGRWLKKPGDRIENGDIIAEIETDKATMELQSFESGTLQKILVEEGKVVPIGQVIALIGDGSSMYSIQSLWSAAQLGLDVTFVVLNNGGYAAMKRHAGLLGFAPGEKVVGIAVPGIRYDQLAIAQGCPGERVTDAQGLHAVLEAALARKGCSLVEVVIG